MTFQEKIEKAKQLIKEYIKKYPRHIIATSFGKDSIVLHHLVKEMKPAIPVFAVLADTKFPQTIEFKDRLVKE